MTLAVPDSSEDPRDLGSGTSAAERRLIERARRDSQSALRALFTRYGSWLRKWARGRLPRLVRGALDTSDLVQDALHHTFARLKWFKPNHGGSLRAYLRRSIENRIRDELRRAACRQDYILPEERVRTSDVGAPQFRQLMDDETWQHYLTGLKRLSKRDRRLLVGRAELGYNYRQLAFAEGLSGANAARKAVRRALIRLIAVMPDLRGG